ncbi:MAG: hypothetical protein FWE53_02505 [Firmicutes bacterium]|nr:hypothetical protein [Bacillota bacterium]
MGKVTGKLNKELSKKSSNIITAESHIMPESEILDVYARSIEAYDALGLAFDEGLDELNEYENWLKEN